jgi:hypothetical protein
MSTPCGSSSNRFGRETNQEVVVAELSGAEGSWFFRIREYDE